MYSVDLSRFAPLSRWTSSALFRSPGNGPALGGGDETGVWFVDVLRLPHPFRFSLAHEPQEEKYAPALARAFVRSGACVFPVILSVLLPDVRRPRLTFICGLWHLAFGLLLAPQLFSRSSLFFLSLSLGFAHGFDVRPKLIVGC